MSTWETTWASVAGTVGYVSPPSARMLPGGIFNNYWVDMRIERSRSFSSGLSRRTPRNPLPVPRAQNRPEFNSWAGLGRFKLKPNARAPDEYIQAVPMCKQSCLPHFFSLPLLSPFSSRARLEAPLDPVGLCCTKEKEEAFLDNEKSSRWLSETCG